MLYVLKNALQYNKLKTQHIMAIMESEAHQQLQVLRILDDTTQQVYQNGYSCDTPIFGVFLEARARKAKSKGRTYNPMIFIAEVRLNFFQWLVNESLQATETSRFDVILQDKINTHGTAYSFFVEPQNIRAVFVDPSVDTRNNLLSFFTKIASQYGVSYEQCGYQGKAFTPCIQADKTSCMFFAEIFLNKMSRFATFEELKNAACPNVKPDFQNLHPCFFKYAQSISVLDSYIEKHPEAHLGLSKSFSFSEHLEKHKKQFVKLNGDPAVTQNRALDSYKVKMIDKGLELLNSIESENHLTALLQSRVNNMRYTDTL